MCSNLGRVFRFWMMWPQACTHGKHVLSLCQEKGHNNSQELEVRSDALQTPAPCHELWRLPSVGHEVIWDSRARETYDVPWISCCTLLHVDTPIGAYRRARTHTHTYTYTRRDARSVKAWWSGQKIGKAHDCTHVCHGKPFLSHFQSGPMSSNLKSGCTG